MNFFLKSVKALLFFSIVSMVSLTGMKSPHVPRKIKKKGCSKKCIDKPHPLQSLDPLMLAKAFVRIYDDESCDTIKILHTCRQISKNIKRNIDRTLQAIVDNEIKKKNTRFFLSAARHNCTVLLQKNLASKYSTPEHMDAQTTKGQTALIYAVAEGCTETVKLLLESEKITPKHIQSLFDRDYYPHGCNTFHWAIAEKHTETIKILLESKRIPDTFINIRYRDFTALIMATLCNATEIIPILLDSKKISDTCINAGYDFERGNTSLILAAERGYAQAVNILLSSKRVNIYIKGYRGHTALSIAKKKGHMHIVGAILYHMLNNFVKKFISLHLGTQKKQSVWVYQLYSIISNYLYI